MRLLHCSVALLVLSLGIGACGSDDDDDGATGTGGSGTGTTVADMCQAGCEMQEQVGCDNFTTVDACVTECTADNTMMPACEAEVLAMGNCMLAQPVADFQCDADGDLELTTDACAAEEAAFMTCVMGGMGGSM